MAKAAYCSQCGTNVYVTGEGRCPNGHGPESLSNYYEAAETATAPQTPSAGAATQKSKTPLIIGIVLVIVLLCGLGSCCGVTMLLPMIAEDFAVEAGTITPHAIAGIATLP